MRRRTAPVTRALITDSAAATVSCLVRRSYLRWGATDEEAAMDLPGDEIPTRRECDRRPRDHRQQDRL